MARYNVNKNAQTNGDHDKCQDAVREAKKHYTQVKGCAYCSAPCHTQ
jgi:hypothetical protein